jgi:hypothetical protein
MTESERIRKVVDYYDVSVNKFSIQLGLATPQILYDVLKGKNGISKDLAEKITVHCSEVNPGWLLSGEGEMLKETKTVPGTDSAEYWRNLVDYYARELKEKRKDCMEMREELIELKRQFIMLQDECKKKELHPGMQAQE